MTRRFLSQRPPLLALGTIAAGGLALSGCGDEPSDNTLFTSPAQCIEAGFDQGICNAEYQTALSQHLRDAPKFDGKAACETEYGAGRCMEVPREQAGGTGGGSFFLPFMTGYLISSAVQRMTDYNSYGRYVGGGSYTRPTPIFTGRNGTAYRSDPVIGTQTATPRPANVNTRTVSRSGFGGLSSSRGGFSSGG
ncbi:DUF1190 domain-containing protein [Aureimonas sp. Leaf324]|jgi:uncharacterized protein YgiB involved in biofilm formation|uniref:DUF1190 domain-containing protein n=1 Tax=Aureimonas sp. Leaf324 TaxID=1736336 RepID=UPI0006FD07BD|nr:DUF1190 domain-containing protein [Aureimonas sp. Leaf324]KQQ86929.1 hypothetical protein ASF65_19360 [Aureimonas sp. Leaf324]